MSFSNLSSDKYIKYSCFFFPYAISDSSSLFHIDWNYHNLCWLLGWCISLCGWNLCSTPHPVSSTLRSSEDQGLLTRVDGFETWRHLFDSADFLRMTKPNPRKYIMYIKYIYILHVELVLIIKIHLSCLILIHLIVFSSNFASPVKWSSWLNHFLLLTDGGGNWGPTVIALFGFSLCFTICAVLTSSGHRKVKLQYYNFGLAPTVRLVWNYVPVFLINLIFHIVLENSW